jgi:hypothetical protein
VPPLPPATTVDTNDNQLFDPRSQFGLSRFEFSHITANTPPAGKERPAGEGTPAEVAADLLRYREAAGLEACQINFHGNRHLDRLLQSMDCFMREVAPAVSAKA